MGECNRLEKLLRAAALTGVIAALAIASPALASGAATTFTVTGFGDGTGSCAPAGASGNSVCPTLRTAVTQANKQANAPTIFLAPGTYTLNNAAGQLDLASSMNIVGAGPGGAGGTTIDQTDGKNRVLEVEGTTGLRGLEITGGHYTPSWSSGATVHGGGLLVVGVLLLDDALVTGNQAIGAAGPTSPDAGDAAEGGGVDYAAGAPGGSSITNSTITGNIAVGGAGAPGGHPGGSAEGGGIADEGGALRVDDSTVTHNSATGGDGGPGASSGGNGGVGEGGGIFNLGALTLSATTAAGNTAAGGGGGAGPTLAGNAGAGEGGGLFNQGGLEQVVNTTVFSNAAQGGAPAPGGSAGTASGGGLFSQGATSGVVLQSDTFDANQASNLAINTPHTFTIHGTIVSGGSPSNCAVSAPASSESGNLEDDAGGQCGFSPANRDLVGASPQLASSLAGNGGPTQTLAPATTSPVLGAGGQCLDSTSSPPGQPLATDQRGLPRPNPCDIGAFQSQAPTSTARPVLSGVTTRGHYMSCARGTWIGDGPFTFAYQWLRDGNLISGAIAGRYLIHAIDAGHTLACRVTATHYGSRAATSALASVTPNPVIRLLRVRVTGTTVVISLGCRGAIGQRCSGVLKLTVIEKLRGKKVVALLPSGQSKRGRTVTVGRRTYGISARRVRTLRLGLGKTGLELLRGFAHLPTKLTLTQNLPKGSRTIAARKLTLPPVPRPRRR